jgi:hypothetical protein
MPVEIRELVIKTTIVEGNSSSGSSGIAKESKEELISECVEEVMRILNEDKEK